MRSQLSSTKIQASQERFQEEGLLQVTVNNYGQACGMSINGISRPLPPPTLVGGVPVPEPFTISDDGREFDITIAFDFGANPGNVIIDYSKPKHC